MDKSHPLFLVRWGGEWLKNNKPVVQRQCGSLGMPEHNRLIRDGCNRDFRRGLKEGEEGRVGERERERTLKLGKTAFCPAAILNRPSGVCPGDFHSAVVTECLLCTRHCS